MLSSTSRLGSSARTLDSILKQIRSEIIRSPNHIVKLGEQIKLQAVRSCYRTTNSVNTEDEYQWWTKKQMIAELGAELTDDLVSRHMKEDPKATGRFIKPHLCSQQCTRTHVQIYIILVLKISRHPDFPDREDRQSAECPAIAASRIMTIFRICTATRTTPPPVSGTAKSRSLRPRLQWKPISRRMMLSMR